MKPIGTFNHKLRPNKASSIPSEIIFVDTEAKEEYIDTDTRVFHFKLGVACYCRKRGRKLIWGEDWLTFTSIGDFWDWLVSKFRTKGKIYLIAHNQHFDFACLNGFVELKKRSFENTFHVLDSELFIAHFKNKGKSLLALDLFNWFKFSVEKMGEYLKLPKLKVDFLKTSKKYLIKYCTRDVEIIKSMLLEWLRFIKLNNFGRFVYSTAGQAYTAFRHRFMKHDILIHGDKTILNLEREAYMGGRSEAFQLGEIDSEVFALDFNSLYPSVMVDNLFPTKFIKRVKEGSPKWLDMVIKDYSIVARVYVKLKQPFIPKRIERLLFPVGEFWTTLATPEIRFLLKKGCIIHAKDICLYQQAPIFTNYVNSLYKLRKDYKKDDNLIYDTLTKLLLNSLYGKFGQLQRKTEKLGECPLDQVWVKNITIHGSGERIKEYAFGGVIWVQYSTKEEWKNSFPAICAHVTSFARLVLLQAILKAHWRNTIYVDTDSLFVNEQGLKNLSSIIDELKLGSLKLERSTTNLIIHGLKDYEFGDRIKRKGIKKKHIQLAPNKFEQDQWFKMKSLLKMGSLDTPIVKTVPKTLKREYKKGEVLPDRSILPFVISEPFH